MPVQAGIAVGLRLEPASGTYAAEAPTGATGGLGTTPLLTPQIARRSRLNQWPLTFDTGHICDTDHGLRPTAHETSKGRKAMNKKAIILAIMAATYSSGTNAQQSIFGPLVGEWNHIQTGESIRVTRTGDVWTTGGPMARVGGTIEAGGNFAFEGRTGFGGIYCCVYYITLLKGNSTANWRLVGQQGAACPQGIFARVSSSQN
jgi:hypothetical protein